MAWRSAVLYLALFVPGYVYTGYTPGYLGTVVSDDVVVYGTGYYYTPWVGTVWYGPPVTYGLGCGIGWTPWWGWGFSFGFGWSWVPAAGQTAQRGSHPPNHLCREVSSYRHLVMNKRGTSNNTIGTPTIKIMNRLKPRRVAVMRLAAFKICRS